MPAAASWHGDGSAGATSNAVQLEFKNSVTDSGEFVFASERQAAEVSLWLLGSFAANGGGDDSTVLSPA